MWPQVAPPSAGVRRLVLGGGVSFDQFLEQPGSHRLELGNGIELEYGEVVALVKPDVWVVVVDRMADVASQPFVSGSVQLEPELGAPFSPISSAKRAYGKLGMSCKASNLGSPSSAPCSQVTC